MEVKTRAGEDLLRIFISFRYLGDDPGWDLGDLPLRLHRGGLSSVEGSFKDGEESGRRRLLTKQSPYSVQRRW